MPRRVRHYDQPQLAPSAGDLGADAYEANLQDADGVTDVDSPSGQWRIQERPPTLGADANYRREQH